MSNKKNSDDLSPLLNPFFSIEDKDWIKKIDGRYDTEEKIFSYIKNGDIEKVKFEIGVYDANAIKSFSYLSDDTVFLTKMFCRVANITYRIAARQGGLLPLHVHNISEKFAIKIMQSSSEEELIKLPSIIAITYAKAVNEFSCDRYSQEVASAIKYIVYNLSNKITLSKVADHVYINSTSLARKFKKETGFTIIDYTNYMRIQTAKVLILKNVGNMTEIANIVGYSDASYFNKAFLKYTNTTPKKYKIQNTK